jgi:antitoxin VapB
VSSRPTARRVHLFRNGRNQAVRIPREFELPGDEALLHRDASGKLILEAIPRRDILEVISSWKGETEDFPEFEDVPPEDVAL